MMLDSSRERMTSNRVAQRFEWSTGKKLFTLVRAVGGKVLLLERRSSHAYTFLLRMHM